MMNGDVWFSFILYLILQVSNKPGICVKVLSLEPHTCQLQEEMAQLADCALPTELRVRTSCGEISVISFSSAAAVCFHNSFHETIVVDSAQVGFGELPFNRVDRFPTYPDICFRVNGYDFLCHKVQPVKITHIPLLHFTLITPY